MRERSEIYRRWTRYRASKATVFLACAASILATVAVGFSTGGWTTQTSAAWTAARAADKARTEMAAQICVAQFNHTPDAVARLALLEQTNDWQRVAFMQKKGWVSLPGMAVVSGAAELCVERLLAAARPANGVAIVR